MQEIEKAAERGDLTELVLMVIWNRLDVARRDVCTISLLNHELYYFMDCLSFPKGQVLAVWTLKDFLKYKYLLGALKIPFCWRSFIFLYSITIVLIILSVNSVTSFHYFHAFLISQHNGKISKMLFFS